MITYSYPRICIQKLYYERTLQVYNTKAHWRGNRLQEPNPHRVSSKVFLPFSLFNFVVIKTLICARIMILCQALALHYLLKSHKTQS